MIASRNISPKHFLGVLASLALPIFIGAIPTAAQANRDRDSVTDQRPGPDGQRGFDSPVQNGDAGSQAVPSSITLPAGTVIPVRLTEWLSSDKNHSGDRFSATLEQPLVANGWVVALRGQMLTGTVATAKKAGRGSGDSQLGVQLSELTLVDGQVLPVRTQLLQSSTGRSGGRDAGTVVTTTGIGAVIGGAAEGGEGAGIGAGIGAVAGLIGVLSTRGRPTVIAPESMLTFRLDAPVAISTEQSQMVFQPVRPSDYRGDQDAYSNPRPHVRPGPPYPRPYYYADPWYDYGYYPGAYFGYSRFYGPRFGGGYGNRGGFRR